MTAPLIAIVGSYDPKRADQLSLKNIDLAKGAGVELGRELARQGCHVVVYASYPYLLEVDVVSGYVEVKKAKLEPGCIQVHYSVKYDQPSFPEEGDNRGMFTFKPDTNPEWEVSFYRSLREVDGLLMLGGGPSSMIAGVVAMGYRKPIVTIASFGGYAKKIWELLPVQQELLTAEEVYLMADQWRPESAKRYVEILIRQREQLAREEQGKREQAARTEESLREQLAHREDQFNQELGRQAEKLQTEFEKRMEDIRRAERDNRKVVTRYAVVSAIFLVLALALWVIAYGTPDSVIWLVILLIASPLAAGVSGSTIQVAFSALGIGQAQSAQPQKELPPVITNAAMGLVGGGITTLLYIITQLVAIGDVIQPIHYRRLIPFAICTGFAAGFALDVVARKLRETAEKGVLPAFSSKGTGAEGGGST
jgi:hypothetical protein